MNVLEKNKHVRIVFSSFNRVIRWQNYREPLQKNDAPKYHVVTGYVKILNHRLQHPKGTQTASECVQRPANVDVSSGMSPP